MTKQETAKLLTMIDAHFQSFVFISETVEAWHLVLSEFSMDSIWAAYKAYLAQGKEFAPNPGQLLNLVEKSIEIDSGAFYWGLLSNGKCKRSELSDSAVNAFKLWGGRDRMNNLPDAKNPWLDNPRAAASEVSFARKEFIEIFESVADNHDLRKVREITKGEAKQLLNQINVKVEDRVLIS